MESRPLGGMVGYAVVAGLMAGLIVAIFHYVATEPVIERAIELESELGHLQEVTGERPLVDRGAQRLGLFLGFLLYGLTWGLLFSLLYRVVQALPPGLGLLGRGPITALLTGWSVALFPFLKYPGNPPGVGDPETIGYRQALYTGFVVLSLAVTCLALAVRWYLGRAPGWSAPWKWAIVLGIYGAGAAMLYFALPPDPDVVRMPADLVWSFRALSFAGMVLFWVAYAAGFSWLAVRAERSGRSKGADLRG